MKPPIICVILFTTLANAKTLDSVHVNKCCKSTEILDKDKQECLNSTVEDWTSKYLSLSMGKSNKFHRGLPTNWKIREDTRPNCAKFSTFSQRGFSFVAMENGTLFVAEIGMFVPPSNYCLDYDVVLVCMTENDPMANAETLNSIHVNKCCKSTEILDKDKKECLNSTVEDWTTKYLNLSIGKPNKFYTNLPTNWKIREDTRPNCTKFSTLSQRVYSFVAMENGSLFIAEIGMLVPPSNYCLDYDVVLVCMTENNPTLP